MEICSRAVGWPAAYRRTNLVLDALQVVLWLHGRAEHPSGPGLVHRGGKIAVHLLVVLRPVIEGGASTPRSASSGILGLAVVVPLARPRLLTRVKVLIAVVEGQAAYMQGGKEA